MPVLTESIVRRVGGGGGAFPYAATKLGYLGAPTAGATGVTVSDQGSGVTRITLASATFSSDLRKPYQGARWLLSLTDALGDAVDNQDHLEYVPFLGLRVGGVLPANVRVGIGLACNGTIDATTTGFAGSIRGISGTQNGPASQKQRGADWLDGTGSAVAGHADVRVIDVVPGAVDAPAGWGGVYGPVVIARDSWAEGDDAVRAVATQATNNNLATGQDFDTVFVFATSEGALGADATFDVEAYVGVIPRAHLLRQMGFGS